MTERGRARYEQFEPELQAHYEQQYADEDRDFSEYSRDYRYGMALAEDEGYRSRNWEEVEPEAGRHWETQEDTTWDNIKDAVRYGWQRIRGREDQRRPRR